MSNMKPKFIVLCGGDGSGKSTILEQIKKKYAGTKNSKKGPKILQTREPGGSPYAENIRKIMFKDPLSKNADSKTMFGLFWAARADHMSRLILPALAGGSHVISDRFDCCTYAYQIYAQQNGELKNLFWKVREFFLKERTPDLYIFLDVHVEEGMRRAGKRKRNKNHFDDRDIAFHTAVRRGYMDFIKEVHLRDGKSLVIDANQPLKKVCEDVMEVVDSMLK